MSKMDQNFNRQNNGMQYISIKELLDGMREKGYNHPEKDLGYMAEDEQIPAKLLEQIFVLDTSHGRTTKNNYFNKGTQLRKDLAQYARDPGSIDIYIEESLLITLLGSINKINTRQNSSMDSLGLIDQLGTYKSDLMNDIINQIAKTVRDKNAQEAEEAAAKRQKRQEEEERRADENAEKEAFEKKEQEYKRQQEMVDEYNSQLKKIEDAAKETEKIQEQLKKEEEAKKELEKQQEELKKQREKLDEERRVSEYNSEIEDKKIELERQERQASAELQRIENEIKFQNEKLEANKRYEENLKAQSEQYLKQHPEISSYVKPYNESHQSETKRIDTPYKSDSTSESTTKIYSDGSSHCSQILSGANVKDSDYSGYTTNLSEFDVASYFGTKSKAYDQYFDKHIDLYKTEQQSDSMDHSLKTRKEEDYKRVEAEEAARRQNETSAAAINANKLNEYQTHESSGKESYWTKVSDVANQKFDELIKASLEKYDKKAYEIENYSKEIKRQTEEELKRNPDRDYLNNDNAASSTLQTASSAVSHLSSSAAGTIQMVKLYCDMFNEATQSFEATGENPFKSFKDTATGLKKHSENVNDIVTGAQKSIESFNERIKTAFENARQCAQENGVEFNPNATPSSVIPNSSGPVVSSPMSGFDTPSSSSSEATINPLNKVTGRNVNDYTSGAQAHANIVTDVQRETEKLSLSMKAALMVKGAENVATSTGEKVKLVGSVVKNLVMEEMIHNRQTQINNISTETINKSKPIGGANVDSDDRINLVNTGIQRAFSLMAMGNEFGKNVSKFTLRAARITRQTFEMDQSDTTMAMDQLTRYAPAVTLALNASRLMAEAKKADKMLNSIDAKKIAEMKEILKTTKDPKKLNALNQDILNKFSVDMLTNGKESAVISAQLAKALERKGFKLSRNGVSQVGDIDLKLLRRNIKTLKQQAKSGITGAKENLTAMQALYISAAKGGYKFNMKMLVNKNSLMQVGGIYGRILKGGTNNSAATDMLSAGGKIFSIARGDFLPFRNAYKQSIKILTQRGNFNAVAGFHPIQNVKLKYYKGVNRVYSFAENKALSALDPKARAKMNLLIKRRNRIAVGKRVPKRSIGKFLTGRANFLKKGIKKLSVESIKNAIGKLSAKIAAEGVTKVAGSAIASALGQTAAHALGVGTGGIAYVVYAIIAVIVCCVCCCCSFGTGYSVYENANVFALDENGASEPDAENSIAVQAMEFMYNNYDKNYSDFILRGAEKYINKLIGANTEIAAFDYTEGGVTVSYLKGKLTYMDPADADSLTDLVYEKYVFTKDPKSILYSDYDHTAFITFGGGDFRLKNVGGKGTVVNEGQNPTDLFGEYTPDAECVNQVQRPIYNDREIVAMSAAAMLNDYGVTGNATYSGSGNPKKSLANFEKYSFTLWLTSHYCVKDTNWLESIFNYLANMFSALWGGDTAATVESNFSAGLDEYYVTNISCVWETANDQPNKIAPLSQNIFSPESKHYINTPLVFTADGKTAINNAFTSLSNSYTDYCKFVPSWKTSPVSLTGLTPEQLKEFQWSDKPNPLTGVTTDENRGYITNSPYLNINCYIAYIRYDYELTSAATTALSNYSNLLGTTADSEDTLTSQISAKASAITSLTADTAYQKKSTATSKGYDYTTRAAAETKAKAIVNDIYDKLGTYFGSDTESSEIVRGSLFKDISSNTNYTKCGEATIPYDNYFITRNEALAKVTEAYDAWEANPYYVKTINASNISEADRSVTALTTTSYSDTTTNWVADTDDVDGDENTTELIEVEVPVTRYKIVTGTGTVKISATQTAKYETVPILFTVEQYNKHNTTAVDASGELTPGTSSYLPGQAVLSETTSKDIYLFTHYFVCGGHTQLVIQPVVLTYAGSTTMFDIGDVLDTIDSGGATNIVSIYKDYLGIETISFTQTTTNDIWSLDNPSGRENRLNAVNMVGKNWAQYYQIDWTATGLNDASIYKLIDPYAETLYTTQEEAKDAGTKLSYSTIYPDDNARVANRSIEVIMREAEIALYNSSKFSAYRNADGTSQLDYNKDDTINRADLDAAVEDGVNDNLLKAIAEAVNRLERVSFALSTVGSVGYTQYSHDYPHANPLKSYWSYTYDKYNVTIDGTSEVVGLTDILGLGDSFHYDLLYKTDCSGFAGYVAGWDAGDNSGWIPTTSFFITSPTVTVKLPPISSTINEFDDVNDNISTVDPITRFIYNNNKNTREITYTNSNVTWTSCMNGSTLLPGDFVTTDGHVMVYIGPALFTTNTVVDLSATPLSSYSSYTVSEYRFAECTANGGILGPGAVKLSQFNTAHLNTYELVGYKRITSIPFDLRNIDVLDN